MLQRAPDPLRRVESLAQEGWLSALSARVLTHAVGLGRNLLLVGPWAPSVALMAAILADGQRVAVVGSRYDALPDSWARLQDGESVRLYGADRVGAWSLDAHRLGHLMAQCSGVVGWMEARRLERALIRLESSVAAEGRSSGPMHILSSQDLVVQLALVGGEPRVQQVTEIALAEDGYRPRPLFAVGVGAMPNALVPIALPSFLGDLSAVGQGVLVDDLRHAVGNVPGPQSPPIHEPSGGQNEARRKLLSCLRTRGRLWCPSCLLRLRWILLSTMHPRRGGNWINWVRSSGPGMRPRMLTAVIPTTR